MVLLYGDAVDAAADAAVEETTAEVTVAAAEDDNGKCTSPEICSFFLRSIKELAIDNMFGEALRWSRCLLLI